MKQYKVPINLQQLIDGGYVPSEGETVYDVYAGGINSKWVVTGPLEPTSPTSQYPNQHFVRVTKPRGEAHRSLARYYFQYRMVTIVEDKPA